MALLVAGMLPAQQVPFTSSDAADAAERISGRRAHMSGEIHRLAGTRVVGPAVTLRIVRDDKASLLDEGLKAIKIVEEAPPGAVIVACLDGDKDFAVFGATFATLAKSRRLGGFVVDGGMRGLADLRRIGVPVFARSTVPGSAGGHYRLEQSQTTVRCGGADVSPGDLVVADEDGVSVVPKAIQAEALAKASALRSEKDAMLPLIAKYRSYTKAVEEYRRQAVARCKSLMMCARFSGHSRIEASCRPRRPMSLPRGPQAWC
jgi:regulator of RNase E activity RraA